MLPLPLGYAKATADAVDAFASKSAPKFQAAVEELGTWVKGEHAELPIAAPPGTVSAAVFQTHRITIVARLQDVAQRAAALIALGDAASAEALGPVAAAFDLLSSVQVGAWQSIEGRMQLGDAALLLLLGGALAPAVVRFGGWLVALPVFTKVGRAAVLAAAAGAGAAFVLGPGEKLALGLGAALMIGGIVWVGVKIARSSARQAIRRSRSADDGPTVVVLAVEESAA